MTRVYLINLSFGLAGVERRFANLWNVLRDRGRVEPILVIPSVLANILRAANLLPNAATGVIEVPVVWPIAWLSQLKMPQSLQTPQSLIQSRTVAFGYYRRWRSIARDADAVVHIGMPCSALRPPDLPTVYECMDATFRSFPSRHFRLASRRRAMVHCQSERIRRRLDETYAAQPTRWQTVTNPIYFARYPASSSRDAKNPKLFAFVGRFTQIKNPLLFLEALAIAREGDASIRALMLGEGPLRGEVDAAIERLGLASHVEVSFDANAPKRLLEVSVYVSLQADDNYGSQALLEAMGAGCAVIASKVGETERLISEAVGTCVPLSAREIGSAMLKMIAHPESTRDRGEAASRLARTRYSADAYADYLEVLYQRAREFHKT